MSIPSIVIRDDGRGFIIRNGGIDWKMSNIPGDIGDWLIPDLWISVSDNLPEGLRQVGVGQTIMEAVDNALLKVRAAEKSTQGDKETGR